VPRSPLVRHPDAQLQEEYLVRRYAVTTADLGAVARRPVRAVSMPWDMPQFPVAAAGLAADLRNAVISDQVLYQTVTRAELSHLVREHLFNNVVKVPCVRPAADWGEGLTGSRSARTTTASTPASRRARCCRRLSAACTTPASSATCCHHRPPLRAPCVRPPFGAAMGD
jgi:hypothetical protein